ncbi:MAG: ankyrin repeat domain-containing protein [bacterium]
MSELRHAIEKDNPDQLQLLLDMGHDVNERNEDGNSLLHIAGRVNVFKCTPLLVKKELNIRERNISRKTPVDIAVIHNSVEFINSLIEKEIIDSNFIQDNKLLMLTTENNSVNILKEFLKLGADPHEKNWHGRTPLFIATENDAFDVAEILIQNGANVNSKDKEQETPLFPAVKENAIKTTRLLIENGANVNA